MVHNKKIILFFFFVLIVNVFYFVNVYNEFELENYVSKVNESSKKIEVIDEHKSKIMIYFPISDYEVLNETIFNKMEEYVNSFRINLGDFSVQPDFLYTLIITYKEYTYKDYLSYAFYIETYTGGAHPNHEIWTVTYDKVGDKLVDIYDLMAMDSDILEIFSKVSREELLRNKNIVNSSMMMEGTKPLADNFSNFAFSSDGLLLFFSQYQVAPYSSGSL